MSPVGTAGPFHSRSTSVNGGGPVSTGDGMGLNGLDATKSVNRVFPHLDDLKMARPDVNLRSPIRTILQEGEKLAKQADTSLDFRRPEFAYQDYVKAVYVVKEVIPRHKDFPSLQDDRPDLHRTHIGLVKRVKVLEPRIEDAIKAIKENNARSGVQPAGIQQSSPGLKENLRIHENGHALAQSVKSPISSIPEMNGDRGASERANDVANPTPSPSSPEYSALVRKKPPLQPKPQALHGKALENASQAASKPPTGDLAARFARLRGSQPQSPTQDPRIRTQQITVPDSVTHSPPVQHGKSVTSVRPSGPREMLPPPSIARPPKNVIDVEMPGLPRQPDAIYSPTRRLDSPATINLPSSVSRKGSYLGSNTSASAVQTDGRATTNSNHDYFTPAIVDSASKIQSSSIGQIPDSTSVTAEQLVILMKDKALRLLLVDLRSRSQFDEGHVLAQSIICIEPITIREGISADELGESIILSPDSEQKLYERRNEFDLIVFYDQSASSVKPQTSRGVESRNYLRDFDQAIYDYGYEKRPKRRPMLLVGGLDAWVDLMGPGSLTTQSTTIVSLSPSKPSDGVNVLRDSWGASSKFGQNVRPFPKYQDSKERDLRHPNSSNEITTVQKSESTEFSYVRTTEDFLRKYPDLATVQESMISTRPHPSTQPRTYELNSSLSRPPARPAPALPRQRSSGISEKTHITSYAMANPDLIPKANVGLTGLSTNGVSCYYNSALQALSATPGFRNYLLSFVHDPGSIPVKDNESLSAYPEIPKQLLAKNLSILFQHLWSGDWSFVNPKTFTSFVKSINSRTKLSGQQGGILCGGDQQLDTQEFTNYILDVLSDELNPLRNRQDFSGHLAEIGDAGQVARSKLPKIQAMLDAWQAHERGQGSMISDLFNCQVMVSSECTKCSEEFKTFTSFTIYQLQFPENHPAAQPKIELDELFHIAWGREQLASPSDCSMCKTPKVSTARRTKVSRFPEYLVLYVVRTPGSGATISTRVNIPPGGIDLSKYSANEDKSPVPAEAPIGFKGPFVYDCYAVVFHSGTLRSGHYKTVAKSTDVKTLAKDWHIFNDQTVSTVGAELDFKDKSFHETLIFLKRRP